MELITFNKIEPANEIKFCIKDTWLLAITKQGFVFNHDDFPTGTPQEFADKFVDILEKHFTVEFTKKKKLRDFHEHLDQDR